MTKVHVTSASWVHSAKVVALLSFVRLPRCSCACKCNAALWSDASVICALHVTACSGKRGQANLSCSMGWRRRKRRVAMPRRLRGIALPTSSAPNSAPDSAPNSAPNSAANRAPHCAPNCAPNSAPNSRAWQRAADACPSEVRAPSLRWNPMISQGLTIWGTIWGAIWGTIWGAIGPRCQPCTLGGLRPRGRAGGAGADGARAGRPRVEGATPRGRRLQRTGAARHRLAFATGVWFGAWPPGWRRFAA